MNPSIKFYPSHFQTFCDVSESRYGDLKFSEKIRSINESKLTLKSLSRVRNVLERSIKAQIEDLDVNFYISDEGVHILDFEFRCVVLKLRE